MNASVGSAPRTPPVAVGWNSTTDDLLYDYPMGGGGGGGTNESEYDYDYEAALDTFFWSQLAPPLAVYAATYVVGVAGNGLIIFTICRFRRLKTTTNVFLASLASADLLLILLCIPVKVSRLMSRLWCLSSQPMTRGTTAATDCHTGSAGARCATPLGYPCHVKGIGSRLLWKHRCSFSE